MTQNATLRQVSGLSDAPTALHNSALVLIDCQNTYREGIMKLIGVEAALDEAAKLLARARTAGIPIFHIRHDAGAGSPYDLKAKSGAFAEQVTPQDGEAIISKAYPNSFVQTTLNEQLKQASVTNLVVGGFMTHMCVNSTVRGAFSLGYAATVVASTTATRDLPRGGEVIKAQALHEASLASISDLFGVVVEGVGDVPD